MKKVLVLTTVLGLGALGMACGGDAPANTTNVNKPANTPAPATNQPAADTAPAANASNSGNSNTAAKPAANDAKPANTTNVNKPANTDKK